MRFVCMRLGCSFLFHVPTFMTFISDYGQCLPCVVIGNVGNRIPLVSVSPLKCTKKRKKLNKVQLYLKDKIT